MTATSHQDVLEHLRLCLPRIEPLLREEKPISDLGLDSMDIVELLCVIHQEFGVKFTDAEFQPHHTLRDLEKIINQRKVKS